MNENTSDETSGTARSLEPRLEGLLSEFFQNEIPAGLGQGELNWTDVDSNRDRGEATHVQPATGIEPRSSWQRHLTAAIALTAVAACAVVFIRPFQGHTSDAPVAVQQSTEPPVDNGEEMMLVSPGADQQTGAAANAVIGDHGLTVGETEDIDLSPQQPIK